MTASDTRRAFAAYLLAHPEVTLDGILHQSYDQGFRPAGAVLAEMAYRRRGTGLKALLGAARTDSELAAALGRMFEMSWPAVQAEWRRTALTSGARRVQNPPPRS